MRKNALVLKGVIPALLLGVMGAAGGIGYSGAALAESEAYSVARGGLLYDKWFAVVEMDAPTTPHPAYPEEGKARGKKGADWRCKECHGWDYMGSEGAYSSGSHYTGIKGIRAMSGADTAAIVAILKDDTHGYTEAMLSPADFENLALFVSRGQVDMDGVIDRGSKQARGDSDRGQSYYETLCSNCHGLDGKKVTDMDPMGKISGNPWETLHKILNGQPKENMPALRALDLQVAVDILAYVQTLPKE
jgi:thiosulfate dehydrogenase